MEKTNYRIDIRFYENDPKVIIGLYDARLRKNSSFETSERIIKRLQFIGKAYEFKLTPLIDSNED